MKMHRFAFTMLLLIAIATSTVLPACRAPWEKPTQPPATPITGISPAPTTQPTVLPATQVQPSAPTDTVKPSPAAPKPTLVPPSPPTVVARVPARGQELPVTQPIVISFDQPMDEQSVQQAFSIEPPVQGTLVFKGNDALFVPAQPFQRGAVYQVTVAETAKSAAGLPMNRPMTFRFQTVGYLEVTSVTPADGTQEVGPDTTIVVVFNRPVVPLVSVEDQKNLPHPLVIDPPLEGEGAWINTSIYAFRPKTALASATVYRVTVKAGLTDVTGGVLAEDYTWSFSTEWPKVVSTAPSKQQERPDSKVVVNFNVPMDHASVEAAFTLTPADSTQAVSGRFLWTEDSRSFTFVPDQLLEFGKTYHAALQAGAKAAAGPGRIKADEKWSFTVVGLPRVLRSNPKDGDKNVEVYGSVEVWFTAPVDEKTLWPNITILPKPTQVYTYYAYHESSLWISFDREPQTEYTVTLGSKIADEWGNTLPSDYVIRFRTGDLNPSVVLNTPGLVGTYNTYTETRLSLTYRNITSLSWALYKLSLEDFIGLSGQQSWEFQRTYSPSRQNLIREETIALEVPRNQTQVLTLRLSEEAGQSLDAGLYYFTVTAPEIVRKEKDWRPPSHLLVVSPYHMILKAGVEEALVWVTDLATGTPVKGLPIRLIDEQSGKLQAGVTDADGLFHGRFAPRDVWSPLFAFAGELGGRFGAVISYWNEGISPWEFNLSFENYQSPYVGFAYTDRPIYRPGQTVHFKGVIRADHDAQYTLPEQLDEIQVTIWDGEGKEVYKDSFQLSDMGTFFGDFELAEEASLGFYHLEARSPAVKDWSFGTDFQVAEYRKPEFEVSVTTDADEYVQGDTINVTVQANYYFGGPVRNAAVSWTLLSRDWWFTYAGEGWYDFTDMDWWERYYYSEYGEPIANGQGQTDEQGRFTFQVPAEISKKKLSQLFTVDVSVTDINDQLVASRASVVVHKGEFYIGLRPKEYVLAAGKEATIEIITVDPQSQPVPSVELQVIAYSTTWDTVQEEGPDGRLYWTSKVHETSLYTRTVTTDAGGKASFTFIPESGGTYRVRAIGRDAHENEIRSSTNIWVSGREDEFVSWRRENHNRIDLIADKKEYKPGDVAKILVPSPFQGEVQALVTVERGRLIDTRVITLRSNSEIIEIPIQLEHIPNVFISVVIVKGRDETEPLGAYRVGYLELPVSSEAKKLTVTIMTDKETYQPRQEATYTIRATDWMGRPVQAEFSLSLVDLSVLALGGAAQGDMVEAFWHKRGIGFYTAGTLVMAVDRITQLMEKERPGAKGGGGGPGAAEVFVRKEFPDTAYWNPAVMTNQNGEARVTVTLPDSLTTWRMDVRGLTAETQVGTKTHDVVSTLPLMVRPVLPRFFVIGDQAQISGIVHNNTDQEIDTTVNLTISGLETSDPLEQRVTIPAHDLVKLSWNVTVQNVEQARVRYSAQGGGLADAVEITLPVYHPSTPETVATAGQLDTADERVESIVLPEVLDPSMGELTITLDRSLAAGMRDGLHYLEHYPYECVEQTLSRFLPNVVTYRALRELGVENKELEARLPQMVSIGLQRLYNSQHFDGGWGWWVQADSDDYLTAYVLYGLTEAHKAGFEVDQKVMQRAAAFVRGSMIGIKATSTTWQANREVFKVYALANYDAVLGDKAREMSQAVLLYESRDKLSIWAKALLANALGLLDPEETSRLKTLLTEITSKAIVSATGAHWEESEQDYINMNTDTRTTAIVLSALARHDPQNPFGANAVRWLMSVRKEGRWESTYETVWSLLGLTDWMLATGELRASYSYAVLLNGATLTQGTANKDNLAEQVKLQVAVRDLLMDQANRLVFRRSAEQGQTGEGRLYYTAHLNYYLPVEHIKALDRGIIVSREYRLADAPAKPISEAKVGDVIQVRLTIIAPHDLHYVVVEDPLPAGCEAVDVSLETTSATVEGPALERIEKSKEPWWRWWWYGWWSPTHTDLRDEKVVLFATYLARGTYQYTYMIRASLPGQFMVIPTTAYEMYFPEVFGRTDGMVFRVERE